MGMRSGVTAALHCRYTRARASHSLQLAQDAEELVNLKWPILGQVGAVDSVLHLGEAVRRAQRAAVKVRRDLGVVRAAPVDLSLHPGL